MTKTQEKEGERGSLPANLIQDLTLAKTIGDARLMAQMLIDSNTLPEQ